MLPERAIAAGWALDCPGQDLLIKQQPLPLKLVGTPERRCPSGSKASRGGDLPRGLSLSH